MQECKAYKHEHLPTVCLKMDRDQLDRCHTEQNSDGYNQTKFERKTQNKTKQPTKPTKDKARRTNAQTISICHTSSRSSRLCKSP